MTSTPLRSVRRENSWVSTLKLDLHNLSTTNNSNTSSPTSSAPPSATHSRRSSISARSWYDMMSENEEDDESYLEEAYLDLMLGEKRGSIDYSSLESPTSMDDDNISISSISSTPIAETPSSAIPLSSLEASFERAEFTKYGKPIASPPREQAAQQLLQSAWTFYFDEGFSKNATTTDYESNMKTLGTVTTIQEFWTHWQELNKSRRQSPNHFNIRLFRKDVKPLLEDSQNASGGKFVLQTTDKENRHNFWSDILLAVIGGVTPLCSKEFDITGIVLSSRPRHDAVQIWNGCSLNAKRIKQVTMHIRNIVNQHISNPNEIIIQYEESRQPIQLHEKQSVGRGRGYAKSHRLNRPPILGSPKDGTRKSLMTTGFSAPSSPSSAREMIYPKANNTNLPSPSTSPTTPVDEPQTPTLVETQPDISLKHSNIVADSSVRHEKVTDAPISIVQEQPVEVSTPNSENPGIVLQTAQNGEIAVSSKKRKKSVNKRNSGVIVNQRGRALSFDISKSTVKELLALTYDREALIRFILVLLSAVMLQTVVYL